MDIKNLRMRVAAALVVFLALVTAGNAGWNATEQLLVVFGFFALVGYKQWKESKIKPQTP